MTQVTELDPFDTLTNDSEGLTLEEIRAKANEGTQEDKEKPRNSDGTFAKKYAEGEVYEENGKQFVVVSVDENGQITDSEEAEVEEKVFERKIDLGDGSGIQVFQGATLDELVDKLVKAQENATKKIRQLQDQTPKSTRKQRTAEDEFLLSQEFASKPSVAFAKMFQEEVGIPISEFKNQVEAVKAFNATKAADAAAEQFVALTPDYFATATNGKKMQAYLKTNNLPATSENLTKAFTELTADGLLKAKPPTETEVTQTQTPPPTRPKSSGLSPRGGTPGPKPKTGLTQEELYQIPLHQLRNLGNGRNAGPTKDAFDF